MTHPAELPAGLRHTDDTTQAVESYMPVCKKTNTKKISDPRSRHTFPPQDLVWQGCPVALQPRRQSSVGEWASTLRGLLSATLRWQVISILHRP